MNKLKNRITLVMLGLIISLGIAFYYLDRLSIELYSDELSQRLNASLAMYVVNEHPLIVDGVVNKSQLQILGQRAMVINPTAEIYLLDTQGAILGHGLHPEQVVLKSVELSPIKYLLSGNAELPLKAQDPTAPEISKVFSAFPVHHPISNVLEGYVYVVLGGAQFEAISEEVAEGDQRRIIIGAMMLLMLAAFVLGGLVFSMLTKPLRRLQRDVISYTQNQFDPRYAIADVMVQRSEIDELRHACALMSEKILLQVEHLKENDRLRRELISNVSHDLRTPLASMQGYIETLMLKGEQLTETEKQSYLEIARKNALRLNTLIGDLFELAKLDSNSISPNFEHFPLMELMQDVIHGFELRARAKSIRLTMQEPSQAIMVYADIGLIQRVLENLITNAIKYTPAGGDVTVEVQPLVKNMVTVAISDTGIGIPAADLDRVFDRFYRAQAGDEASADSTGLGLAISKRILELHQSEITVTSTLNIGTQFRFELPLAA